MDKRSKGWGEGRAASAFRGPEGGGNQGRRQLGAKGSRSFGSTGSRSYGDVTPPIRMVNANYQSERWRKVGDGMRAPESPYRARRASERRNRVRKRSRLLPIVMLVALLSGALVWATHAPLFSIRTIEVQGNVLTSKNEVLRAAGVRVGTNLLLPIAREVRARVARMPEVMDAEVNRELPDKLVIRVTEREPWAAIEAGGAFVAVDRNLRVLARVGCPRAGFPLLVLQDATEKDLPAPGSIIRAPIILAGMACIRRTSESDYGIKIPRVFVDVSHNICLNVNNLGVARLGRAEKLGAKLATLRTIVLGSPGLLRKSHFVDLQNPDAPAYSPQEEEPSGGSALNN